MEDINNKVEIIAKWLEVVGFIASVSTFFIVLFLDKRVKQIQIQHLFQVRIDEHLKDLRQTSLNTANLLNGFSSNIKEIRIEVNQCRTNCLSIKKKTGKIKLINLDKLIKDSNLIIKNKLDINSPPNRWNKFLGRRPVEEKDINDFYETLTALISEIKYSIKDSKNQIK